MFDETTTENFEDTLVQARNQILQVLPKELYTATLRVYKDAQFFERVIITHPKAAKDAPYEMKYVFRSPYSAHSAVKDYLLLPENIEYLEAKHSIIISPIIEEVEGALEEFDRIVRESKELCIRIDIDVIDDEKALERRSILEMHTLMAIAFENEYLLPLFTLANTQMIFMTNDEQVRDTKEIFRPYIEKIDFSTSSYHLLSSLGYFPQSNTGDNDGDVEDAVERPTED
jgi:hypothetical protein